MQQPGQACKEVNFDLDASSFSSDDFRMFSFKVKRCPRARPHDWTQCPFAHPGEKAKRRDITRYRYSGSACPEFRRNGCCRRADACPFAHGVFECWLHPSRYRTQMCTDGTGCKRRVCFFAHTEDELRKPEDDPIWLQQQLQSELNAEQQQQNQMQALKVFSSLFSGSGQQQNTQPANSDMLKNIPLSQLSQLMGMSQAMPPAASQPQDDKTKLLQQLLTQQMMSSNVPPAQQQQQNALIMQLLTLMQQPPQQQQMQFQIQQAASLGPYSGSGMQDMQMKLTQILGGQHPQQELPAAPLSNSSLKPTQSQTQINQAALEAVLSMMGMGGTGAGAPSAQLKPADVIQPSASVPSGDNLDLQALMSALSMQAQSDGGGGSLGACGSSPTQSVPLDPASLMAMAFSNMGGAGSESGSCAMTPEKVVDAFKGGMGGNSAAGSSTNTPHYPPMPRGPGSGEPTTSSMQPGGNAPGSGAGQVDLNALSALLMHHQNMMGGTQAQSFNMPTSSSMAPGVPASPIHSSAANNSATDSVIAMLKQVQTRKETPAIPASAQPNLSHTSSFLSTTPKSASADSLAAIAGAGDTQREPSDQCLGAPSSLDMSPKPGQQLQQAPSSRLNNSDATATQSSLPGASASGVDSEESRALLSLWADMTVGGAAGCSGEGSSSQQDMIMKNAKALLESLSLLKKNSEECLDASSLVEGGDSDVSTAVKKAMNRNDSFDMILSELPRSLSDIVVMQEAVAAANHNMMQQQGAGHAEHSANTEGGAPPS